MNNYMKLSRIGKEFLQKKGYQKQNVYLRIIPKLKIMMMK